MVRLTVLSIFGASWVTVVQLQMIVFAFCFMGLAVAATVVLLVRIVRDR